MEISTDRMVQYLTYKFVEAWLTTGIHNERFLYTYIYSPPNAVTLYAWFHEQHIDTSA